MPSSTSSSDSSLAKRSLAALLAVFVALNLIGLSLWQAMPLSKVSEQRYLAAAKDHVEMLRESKGEEGRIILIGGSGAAFSISAERLSEELERPVYNGGIQAGIGFRNLMDMYADHLDPEKDLIVLLPEPELLAGEARYSQVWCDVVFLGKDTERLLGQPRCLPNILHRTYQDVRHHMAGTDTVDPVYRRSGFNAVGDLTSHLEIDRSAPDFSAYDLPNLSGGQLTLFSDYARTQLAERGIDLLYIPAAMPKAACRRSPDRIATMIAELEKLTTDGPVPAEMEDFCLAPNLFFDGAGHLNKGGRELQTANVRKQLAAFLAR
ncbi:MAG: hypothetical protein AAF941_00775 [Pseudomonadota bacterium]